MAFCLSFPLQRYHFSEGLHYTPTPPWVPKGTSSVAPRGRDLRREMALMTPEATALTTEKGNRENQNYVTLLIRGT